MTLDSTASAPIQPRMVWGLIALLLVVTGIIYSGVLGHEFLIYDDDTYVLQNPLIHPLNPASVLRMFTRTYFRSYTPLAHLSHAIDFELWGRDPFGHHLTSYLLHLVNTALVFLLSCAVFILWKQPKAGGIQTPWSYLLERMTPTIIFGAFASATFFSLHPLRVESVAWISDRKDLLMTFFILLSAGAYLLYSVGYDTPEGRRWYLVAFASALLAMLSKTVASMFPVVLVMMDAFLFRHPHNREVWSRLLREKIPFVLGSVFVGAFSLIAVTGILRHPKLYERTTLEEVLLPVYTWTFYFLKNLWPTGLTPVYVHPPFAELVLSLLFVGIITVVCLLLLKRNAHFWFLAWGFYLLFLLPTILGRERAGIQPWADRYSYLPSVALAMLFGAGVMWVWSIAKPKLRLAGGALSLVLLGLLGFLTVRQIPVWHDTVTLFRYAVATNPSAIMAHTNLGLALAATGKPDEAIPPLEKAIALNDRYAGSYEVMALAFDKKREHEKAIDLYRKAISLDTNFIEAYSNLGNTLMALERYDDAIQEYLAAIRKDPEFFDAYYNMGIAQYRKGEASVAMEVFRRAAAINPINSDTYLNMGIIYSDWGDEDAAFAQYQKAADLGNAQARELLGPRFRRK